MVGMNNNYDPHLIGTALTSTAENGSRMFALVTASENRMFDLTDEMLDEIIAEGPRAVKGLTYALVGAFTGVTAALCALTGQDPEEFTAALATHNSTRLELGREIVRLVEGDA